MRVKFLASTIAIALLASSTAEAQPSAISGLFVTGVDASGNRLAGGAVDPHYRILETNSQAVVVSGANCRNAGTWLLPPGQSCWVWETAAGTPINVTRTFRTTFDLTGFDASTAFISGSWATDNWGLDIRINGTSTGQQIVPADLVGFGALTSFSVNSGFVAGINTLDFVVEDKGSVSGFLVGDISGRANRLAQVPEPASLALLGMGFALIGLRARRRTA